LINRLLCRLTVLTEPSDRPVPPRLALIAEINGVHRTRWPVGPVAARASCALTVTLLEADYQYGVGPLTLRVGRIDRANPVRYDGEDFYPVQGVRIGTSGTDLGRRLPRSSA
jgi:hypothetical protein